MGVPPMGWERCAGGPPHVAAMLSLPRIADRIGRYEILSELGRGSMGQVYLALDPNIERKVALKVFLPQLEVGSREEEELRRRFILEARAAGKLRHPGIVTIFDAATDPATGLSFIAMEWVDGPSLQGVLAKRAPLPAAEAAMLVGKVAVALHAAHRKGLVHRDIKPANILCGHDGSIKVTDFGIAKVASLSITTTSWIPGSPFYMSPEQVRNERADPRSDLYSLGAVLYQCLTGVVPFEGDSLASLTYMILEIDPRPPQTLSPRIGAELAGLTMRALAKKRAERFQSGLELARALREAVPQLRAGAEPLEEDEGPVAAGGVVPPVAETDAPRPTRIGPLAAEEAAPTRHAVPAGSPLPSAAAAADFAGAWERPNVAAVLLAVLSVLFVGLVGLRLGRRGEGPVAASQSPPRPPAVRVAEAGERAESVTRDPQAIDPLRMPPPPDPSGAPPAATAEPIVPPVARPRPEPSSGPVARPAPPPRANLELVFRNRLRDASITVWVDEDKVWTRELNGPKSLLKRAFGRNVWTRLPLVAGERVIDVRLTGSGGKLDLVRRIEGDFDAGETRRLRVTLIPPRTLKLAWKETDHG